jgi:glycerophosphoryl diester phosphodiesterase
MLTHPFLKHSTPIAFAHRGGASDAPENTMPAFQRAIDLGYIYMETDVHVTRDGVLLAFHDDDLSRTCGRPGKISELDYA